MVSGGVETPNGYSLPFVAGAHAALVRGERRDVLPDDRLRHPSIDGTSRAPQRRLSCSWASTFARAAVPVRSCRRTMMPVRTRRVVSSVVAVNPASRPLATRAPAEAIKHRAECRSPVGERSVLAVHPLPNSSPNSWTRQRGASLSTVVRSFAGWGIASPTDPVDQGMDTSRTHREPSDSSTPRSEAERVSIAAVERRKNPQIHTCVVVRPSSRGSSNRRPDDLP